MISIKLSTCLLSTCQTWPRFCFHTVLNTEPTFNLRIFKTWLVFVLIQFWTLNLHSHGCLRQVNVGQFLWYSVTMSAGTAPAPALCTQTAGELFTVHDDRCVSKICIYKLTCIIIFCFSMLFFSRGMSVRIGCGYVCTVHLRIFMHQSISVWCEWDLPGRHIRDNKGFWMFSWFYMCIRKGVLFWQIKTNKSLDNECPVLIL